MLLPGRELLSVGGQELSPAESSGWSRECFQLGPKELPAQNKHRALKRKVGFFDLVCRFHVCVWAGAHILPRLNLVNLFCTRTPRHSTCLEAYIATMGKPGFLPLVFYMNSLVACSRGLPGSIGQGYMGSPIVDGNLTLVRLTIGKWGGGGGCF